MLSMTGLALSAQQASISGTVSDRDGAAPGATVTLKDSKGASRTATTDATGKYSFGGLSPGDYSVTARLSGFVPATKGASLTSAPLTVDINLEVSSVSTSVTVSGGGGLTVALDVPTTAGSRLNLAAIDTPATVSTLSGDDIMMRDDTSVNSAVTRAVGVTSNNISNSAGNSVAIRGFNGATVAFLYDGIRNEGGLGNVGWPYDPFMVESINVINGLSSVLYGVNGIGGAINVIPKSPEHQRHATLRLSGGSFNTYRLSADTTGELSANWLYRLVVSRYQSDGYIDRGANGSTEASGALTYIRSPKLRFVFRPDFAYVRPLNNNGQPLINGAPQRSLWAQNYGTLDQDTHFYENSWRIETYWTPTNDFEVRNISSFLYSARLFAPGGTQLTYQPSLNQILRNGYGKFRQRQFQFNDQVESTLGKRFLGRPNTLSFGGVAEFAYLTRSVFTWPNSVSALLPLEVQDPGVFPAASQGSLSFWQRNEAKLYSIFVDDRWKITNRLSIIGGFRFDSQNVTLNLRLTNGKTNRTFNTFNSRAAVVYTLGRGLNLYGQYSEATDALANLCCLSASQLGFKAAHGEQTEAGIKQSTLNGRLQWTLSAYRIVKTNLLIPNPASLTLLQQVGSQSSKGIEATFAYNFGRGLTLGGNGTILRPRYDNFIETLNSVGYNRTGKRPTNVPATAGNLFATAPIRRGWTAQATLRYVGKRYFDNANSTPLGAYVVVDAGLRWSVNDRIAIDFRGANLFNRFYAYNYYGNGTFNSSGIGNAAFLMGAPRSGTVVFTWR
jgi:iron complex outermembrane receptor protein